MPAISCLQQFNQAQSRLVIYLFKTLANPRLRLLQSDLPVVFSRSAGNARTRLNESLLYPRVVPTEEEPIRIERRRAAKRKKNRDRGPRRASLSDVRGTWRIWRIYDERGDRLFAMDSTLARRPLRSGPRKFDRLGGSQATPLRSREEARFRKRKPQFPSAGLRRTCPVGAARRARGHGCVALAEEGASGAGERTSGPRRVCASTAN